MHLRYVNEYRRVGLETGVSAASPHRMVEMLYDGAIRYVREAGRHMQKRDTAAKGEAISRAIAIIEQGLSATLDRERGGSLAERLFQLYDYMGRRLLVANLRNDAGALSEVEALLAELRDAWMQINPDTASSRRTAFTA
ncbi:MAG: flagellar export chaperone FliS [Burkholderiales bacterium]